MSGGKLYEDEAEEKDSESSSSEEEEEEVQEPHKGSGCSTDSGDSDERPLCAASSSSDYEQPQPTSRHKRLRRIKDEDSSSSEDDGIDLVQFQRLLLIFTNAGEDSVDIAVLKQEDISKEIFDLVSNHASGAFFDADQGIKEFAKRYGPVGRETNRCLLEVYENGTKNSCDIDNDGMDLKIYGGEFSKVVVMVLY
jgi:hypothetical protein